MTQLLMTLNTAKLFDTRIALLEAKILTIPRSTAKARRERLAPLAKHTASGGLNYQTGECQGYANVVLTQMLPQIMLL